MQQVIGLFVLKTRAGFDIFDWIVKVVGDFFGFTIAGKLFMWDAVTVGKQWFIINVVSNSARTIVFFSTAKRRFQIASVVFYMAFVELLYYFGVMEWILKKL